MEDIIVDINGKKYPVKVEESDDGKLKVHLDGETIEVQTKAEVDDKIEELVNGVAGEGTNSKSVKAPLPGTVYDILVREGDNVKKGQSLIKLVAMKMENDIVSGGDGKVKSIKVKKNDGVEKGQELILLE